MCSYQTLFHQDDTGYVIHCRGCDTIQVAYGNVLLTWRRADFYDFCRYIRQMKEELSQDIRVNHKSLVIPVPCEGVKIILSPRELQEWHRMLDAAETELQSQELMQLFQDS
jgi:hypothetical protein